MTRWVLGLSVVLLVAVSLLAMQTAHRFDETASGLHDAVAAQQEALLEFERQRRADMVEVRGMIDFVGTDVEVCHQRVELIRWLAKVVARTLPGRERLPSPPAPWPLRPTEDE